MGNISCSSLSKKKTILKKNIIVHLLGKNISQVAIRWLLQQQTVASVIIGVKTLEQLEENMAASPDWCMSDDDVRSICNILC